MFRRLNLHLKTPAFCTGLRVLLPLIALALSACSTVGYYWQAADGELQLLDARQPISQMLAAADTPTTLKRRLRLARQARAFASAHLKLPRNASYTTYSALNRPYAVWNVYATQEFSVQPITHCFPVAGCVAYKGYFSKADAEADAQRWRDRGDDAAVFGAPAYSTLGWFSDPLLSTMMRWNDTRLVGMIFHELAHQQYYVKGDTRFNESFANFVQREGLRQWRAVYPPASGAAAKHAAEQARRARQRARQITKLMLDTRKRLAAVYAQTLPADMLRARKADVFAGLKQRYRKLRNSQWHGYDGYDVFFDKALNNARLVPFGLYDQWVPGFRVIFQRSGGDWAHFYRVVASLGDEAKAQRDAQMKKLTDMAVPIHPGAAS